MSPPVMLDLFCGAGGAARGYADAGFEVIGVDLHPQPRYPFEFHQADAIEFLKAMLSLRSGFLRVDAIHASPPCQRWSILSQSRPGLAEKYPALIEPTRVLLRCTGLPYVIENVVGAPLIDPVMLCGSHFGLTAELEGYGTIGTHRHRLFEASFPIADPGPHNHEGYTNVSVCGHNIQPHQRRKIGRTVTAANLRAVMGIDWVDRDSLGEMIPPAYTEYIGRQLLSQYQLAREAA